VIVIFFNFESASKDFVRHIFLKDDTGSVYSSLMQMHEINTMENSKAEADQEFVKIFSFFLLYACDRDKFYKKLSTEGIDYEHEAVKMLMRSYDILVGDEKIKEELKIMEMTADDKLFLATRNFADVLEKGREEGREEASKKYADVLEKGREEGIEIGVGTTLSIIRDLNEHKPINEIAAQYKISIQKIEEIQNAMKLYTA